MNQNRFVQRYFYMKLNVLVKLVSICVFLVVCQLSIAQNARLAQQYYQTGEYEKAAEIYYALYKKTKSSYQLDYYTTCMLSEGKYDEAARVLKSELKSNKNISATRVLLGRVYERQSKEDLAEKQYKLAIDQIGNNRSSISTLANAFVRNAKYDLAIETYNQGSKILNQENAFAYNLADLYFRKGDKTNMMKYSILEIEKNPSMMRVIKTNFSRRLEKEELSALQVMLLDRIQKYPDKVKLAELLEWLYLQTKDYNRALRQAIALDLRLEENGSRIFNLGGIAFKDKSYDMAIKAYDYLINEKGSSPFVIKAKNDKLKAQRNKITESYDYTEEQLNALVQSYEAFFKENNKNTLTAPVMVEFAEFQAKYMNDIDAAIALLEEVVKMGGAKKDFINTAKLSLADYYLIKGERWDATLLYSQVDKEYKEAFLGELARFKNAKLSYYVGEFEWAQSQFDILKASTSRLISNDAIDLSVFITDNLGLDTIATPMEMYARSELLSFQNQYDAAFATLDSIVSIYPNHGLIDDIYYSKARIFEEQKQYDKAIDYYQRVLDEFPDEIRADNALFWMAQLYENQLKQPETAKPLYKKLFLDYSASTFAVEARKRYRILRGDEI